MEKSGNPLLLLAWAEVSFLWSNDCNLILPNDMLRNVELLWMKHFLFLGVNRIANRRNISIKHGKVELLSEANPWETPVVPLWECRWCAQSKLWFRYFISLLSPLGWFTNWVAFSWCAVTRGQNDALQWHSKKFHASWNVFFWLVNSAIKKKGAQNVWYWTLVRKHSKFLSSKD